jgi:hypothetical protein
MYALLLGGVIAGASVGILQPAREVSSLRSVVPSMQRRLSLTALACYAAFALLTTYLMVATRFRLDID